jgi:S-methylmethionine-dependent homocysteine/selenocysteine methylase
MSTYRHHLPQLSDTLFVTDGGLETTLVFHQGFDLPEFAAFDLLRHPDGYDAIRDYYIPYLNVARDHGAGFLLESFTWRASREWGQKLGYTPKDLREVNRQAIAMLQDLRQDWDTKRHPVVISGCIGPRGDGYQADRAPKAAAARQYHQEQIDTLAETEADLVSAFTINTAAEAVGITQAAQRAGIPVVIGFTVETDGRLPSGQPLGEAVFEVDDTTGNGPAYYMINCAHPTHFGHVLDSEASWTRRIRAIRANASEKSHAELDEATELDDGNPADLGVRCAELKRRLPAITVFGGCCGTDHRHVAEICRQITVH